MFSQDPGFKQDRLSVILQHFRKLPACILADPLRTRGAQQRVHFKQRKRLAYHYPHHLAKSTLSLNCRCYLAFFTTKPTNARKPRG